MNPESFPWAQGCAVILFGHVKRLGFANSQYCGWTKSISHYLGNLGNDDSPVNTKKQWFSIVSWVVQDCVHPQYLCVFLTTKH